MIDMKELHSELVTSHKNGELTNNAKNMLLDYTYDVMENDISKSLILSEFSKEELLNGGRDFVIKHWNYFNCEKTDNPLPYFKEVFKRGIASFSKLNSKEYKDERFLSSLRSMGMKILKFNLPYEIELDGSIIRKFSFTDENYKAEEPKKE